MTGPVLQVEGLTVALPRGGDRREAVSGVSFEIPQGQLVCLVGESGSGKSIIAHTVMGLTPRNIRATAGEVRINGDKVLVRQHTWGRGAGSGIELEIDTWVVWTFDGDGLVTRIEAFLIHQETAALEAAGMSG